MVERLRSVGGEQVAGGGDAGWGEPVEAAARLVRLGVLVLPLASDPPENLKPVEQRPPRRPAMGW